MKKIFYILVLILILLVGAKFGVFNELQEIEETRSHYQEIYGDKAKYFVFSK